MANSVIRQREINKNLLEYAKINRDNSCFNDVIITAGRVSIAANRLILSRYSIYFEKMFKSNMREKYERNVEVQAIEGESLKTLIDYIYSGSIVINNQNVMSLLSGADYLQLDDVKQFCFEFMQASITPNNCLRILDAASLYRNDALKEEMRQYISAHLNEVAQSDDFKSYSKAQVIECVSTLDENIAKSSSIYRAIVGWVYHNQEERAMDFPKLFKMIELKTVELKFLEKIVLEENLVSTNLNCQKLALKTYWLLLSTRQNLDTNESKLLSIGRVHTKVTIVFDLLEEVPKPEYPDFVPNLKWHSSLKLKDYLFVIGGQVNSIDMNNVWRLNLKNQNSEWEQIASMNKKRSMMGAAVYNDAIVVCRVSDKNFDLTEAYLPIFNEWKALSPMDQGRYGHSLAACDEILFALGGRFYSEYLSSAEKLESMKGEWKHIEPMQTARCYFAAVCCCIVL